MIEPIKAKILFYSDCAIFGGSEKVLFHLLNSSEIRNTFSIEFAYRRYPDYEEGVRRYSEEGLVHQGLRFVDPNSVNTNQKIPGPIKKVLRLFGPVFALHILIMMYLFFKKKRPELLFINNGGYPAALSCRIAAWAGRLAGVPKILMVVNNLAMSEPETNFLKKWLDKKTRQSVNIFVTGSKAAKKALAAIGFDDDKIVQIYHGFARPPASKPPTAPSKGPRNYFCMIANFEARKGHRILIEALARIGGDRLSEMGTKVVLVGDGLERTAIERLVDDAGLAEEVLFYGHREDFMEILAGAMFLINPSTGFEDLPLVIIQAMSLNKAVIGTDVAGIPEEIEDGVSGYVIQPENAEALAGRIMSLLSDKELRGAMAAKAGERYVRLFSLESMVANYLTLLTTLTSRRGQSN